MNKLLVFILTICVSFWAYCQTADLYSIHPTQESAGIALVLSSTQRHLHDAHGNAEQALAAVLEKTPLPVVIDPDGKAWLLDGHHTALIIMNVARLAGRKSLSVLVAIEKDFTGTDWHQFYRYLELKNICYFAKEVREKDIPFYEKVSSLPKTVAELESRNHLLRSLIGFAFKKLEISALILNRYVEFYVAEIISKDLPTHLLASVNPEDAITLVTERVSQPDVLDFLKANPLHSRFVAQLYKVLENAKKKAYGLDKTLKNPFSYVQQTKMCSDLF